MEVYETGSLKSSDSKLSMPAKLILLLPINPPIYA
jgi:hypothetical protein